MLNLLSTFYIEKDTRIVVIVVILERRNKRRFFFFSSKIDLICIVNLQSENCPCPLPVW